jgi:hypothetical protein
LKKGILNTNIILFGIIWPFVLRSQNTDCSNSTTYVNQVLLEINLNGGITSYFGDLSLYDKAPLEKIAYESLPGFGIIANLQLTKTYGISGQFLLGNIHAEKDTVTFQASLMEYNFHGRIDLLNFFRIRHNPDFGLEGYAGLGQFFYTVEKEIRYSDRTENSTRDVSVPEFVYFLGGGLSYRTTKYTTITLDIALRQCQTDLLDDRVSNGDFDYYSYISLGVTIDVGRLINPYLKSRFRLK